MPTDDPDYGRSRLVKEFDDGVAIDPSVLERETVMSEPYEVGVPGGPDDDRGGIGSLIARPRDEDGVPKTSVKKYFTVDIDEGRMHLVSRPLRVDFHPDDGETLPKYGDNYCVLMRETEDWEVIGEIPEKLVE